MTLRALSNFVTSWQGVSVGITSLLVFLGADGRASRQRLDYHLTQEVPALLKQQQRTDLAQDSILTAVDALALSQCLREENAIARINLECGARERRAGLSR